jgi:hypothetical protein
MKGQPIKGYIISVFILILLTTISSAFYLHIMKCDVRDSVSNFKFAHDILSNDYFYKMFFGLEFKEIDYATVDIMDHPDEDKYERLMKPTYKTLVISILIFPYIISWLFAMKGSFWGRLFWLGFLCFFIQYGILNLYHSASIHQPFLTPFVSRYLLLIGLCLTAAADCFETLDTEEIAKRYMDWKSSRGSG